MADERPLPRLETERLTLHLPSPGEAPRVAAYMRENLDHLAPWSPTIPPAALTEAYWRQRLAQNIDEFQQDRSARFFLRHKGVSDTPVVGTCSFSDLVRGAMHGCYLGYGLARECEGQGLMHEALSAAIPYVFEALNLHRISANHMPTNERSARLLRRLGFAIEGYARDYLRIDGLWRDHVLTSLANPNWRG
jgi:ribosomal-protein-alanine N-acetyltransferase